MEKKNLFWMIGIFLVGVIIGGIIVCFVCCNCDFCGKKSCREICKETCKESCMDTCQGKQNEPGGGGVHRPVPPTISIDTAKAYFKCYMKTPISIKKLVAFSVNMEQFTAMQTLLANDSTAAGFRIYMGIMGDPTPVTMVVATDTEGSDNTTVIYRASSSDPCPDLCDDKSEITQ